MIEMVEEYAARHGAHGVRRINVRLGVLSAITRALHVSFHAASRGTLCEAAVLEIEEVPLTVHCHVCDQVKTPSGPYNFRCPDCGHPTPRMVTGREMQLVSIELTASPGMHDDTSGNLPTAVSASAGTVEETP